MFSQPPQQQSVPRTDAQQQQQDVHTTVASTQPVNQTGSVDMGVPNQDAQQHQAVSDGSTTSHDVHGTTGH